MEDLSYLVGEAFAWILQTSWQAAILASLILLAQWTLRSRLAPGWRYGLWLLLIVRLLMPGLPPSAFSIFNLARTDQPHTRVDALQPSVMDLTPHHIVNSIVAFPSLETAPLKEFPREFDSPRINWAGVACRVWFLGVLLLALRLVLTNVRFRSRIAQVRPITDENVIRLFDQCREEFKITWPVQIIESAEVETPGVYGIWQKWLLLPKGVIGKFSREELRHTFLHELAHLKRRDLEVNWLTAVLQILHWFNPAIWLAFARMRADRELATDALALAHVSSRENVAYGETIIKVAANLARCGRQPGLIGIAESKAGLKERLRAIADTDAAKYWTWAAAGLVLILSGVGLTGSLAAAQPETAGTSKSSSSVLSHATAISGTVVDANGRAVNKAQIAVYRLTARRHFTGASLPPASDVDLTCAPTPRLFNPDYGHPIADLSLASDPWSYCTTDARGRFYLNDLNRALGVLAVEGSGFAFIATNEFSSNMTVKLQPWGRIEGTVRHYQEPVANEPVQLFFANEEGKRLWGSSSEFSTKTDDRGRFSFNFVPSGRFGANSGGIGEYVVVKSAQTSVLGLGGNGYSVIGKFKFQNLNGSSKTPDEFRYIFISSPGDLKGKTAEELEALRKQGSSENTLTNTHLRPVQCAKDGSFRIDQVLPGKYLIIAESSPSFQDSPPYVGPLYGEYDVEIPPHEPALAKPFDLGDVEISFQAPSSPPK